MELNLSGKTAIVTGASKGIGLAATRALAEAGASVVAGARHTGGGLAELAAAGKVLPVEVDLATPDGPTRLVEAAADAHGGVDVLVNNVGAVTPRTDGFLSVTDEQWTRTLTVNLLTTVRATRAALPYLLRTGSAAVVTVSSVNAELPDPLVIDYCAAKAAVSNFCKALSKEVGPRGVRVNTVSPGPVSTDMWLGDDGIAATVGHSGGHDPAAVTKSVAAQSVTGRFSRPEEVADLVVILASPRTANVTGADFRIDGGLITTV